MVEFELYRYESILEFGLYIYKHTVVQKFSHLYTDVFDDIRLKIKFYITYIHTYFYNPLFYSIGKSVTILISVTVTDLLASELLH